MAHDITHATADAEYSIIWEDGLPQVEYTSNRKNTRYHCVCGESFTSTRAAADHIEAAPAADRAASDGDPDPDPDPTTRTFDEWTDFLEAIRADRLQWGPGAYARVVYASSYSDTDQVLEGTVTATSADLGHTFTLAGRRVGGWHVETATGRTIGRVSTIEFETVEDGGGD